MHHHLVAVILRIPGIRCKGCLVQLLEMCVYCIQTVGKLFQPGKDFHLLVVSVLIHQLADMLLQKFRRIFQSVGITDDLTAMYCCRADKFAVLI